VSQFEFSLFSLIDYLPRRKLFGILRIYTYQMPFQSGLSLGS